MLAPDRDIPTRPSKEMVYSTASSDRSLALVARRINREAKSHNVLSQAAAIADRLPSRGRPRVPLDQGGASRNACPPLRHDRDMVRPQHLSLEERRRC